MLGLGGWKRVGMVGALAALAAGAGGCEGKPADDGAQCAALRERAEKGNKRWVDLHGTTPAADAPLSALAGHAEAVAQAAQEIGADVAKAKVARGDLVEAAQGVKMLGDLAGKKLEALARTLRELDGRLGPISKVENAANDLAEGLGRDLAASVGCDKPDKPGGACAAVIERAKEIDQVAAPVGFEAAALAARARAESFEGLAKAMEALPSAAPKQKLREQMVKAAKGAAGAFRTLGNALDELGPFEAKLGRERREADEAEQRFTLELGEAASICAPKGAASAKPAAPASSR